MAKRNPVTSNSVAQIIPTNGVVSDVKVKSTSLAGKLSHKQTVGQKHTFSLSRKPKK